jgi:hypothetical protein
VTKGQRRLTAERTAQLLGAQTEQNKQVIVKSLRTYTATVVEPLIKFAEDQVVINELMAERVAKLERPWWKLW